jgi:hypothetical protein
VLNVFLTMEKFGHCKFGMQHKSDLFHVRCEVLMTVNIGITVFWV